MKKENKKFKCPECGLIVNFIGKPGEKLITQCPNCGQKGIILFKKNRENRLVFKSKIIGVILIIISIFLLLIPIPELEKIGLTLIIIGIIIIFLLSEKTLSEDIQDYYVTLGIIMLIWILVLITGKSNLELYLVMIFIGFLVIKEITVDYTSIQFQQRIGILFLWSFLIFLLIVAKRILSIVHI
jgi:predicted RNA-binding Zn-ribbon protein involved in translation (DUF1610 family)